MLNEEYKLLFCNRIQWHFDILKCGLNVQISSRVVFNHVSSPADGVRALCEHVCPSRSAFLSTWHVEQNVQNTVFLWRTHVSHNESLSSCMCLSVCHTSNILQQAFNIRQWWLTVGQEITDTGLLIIKASLIHLC